MHGQKNIKISDALLQHMAAGTIQSKESPVEM
jgi:hypothetical protein